MMAIAFTTPTFSRCIHYEGEVIIEIDASDYVSAGVISQYDVKGVLDLVVNVPKKHTSAKCNYNIFDQEPIASTKALEEWRPKCAGAMNPLQ